MVPIELHLYSRTAGRMRLLSVASRFLLGKGHLNTAELRKCTYRTEKAVFGFCPQTKKAINASAGATEKLGEYKDYGLASEIYASYEKYVEMLDKQILVAIFQDKYMYLLR